LRCQKVEKAAPSVYTCPVFKRFGPILALVTACWVVFVINNLLLKGALSNYGIVPRQIGGLPGIIWAPFLHGSFQHLAANTIPLLILGAILCARNKSEFVFVAIGGTILGGGLTWLFARNASHIGASGLIFCLFGYLASLACFNRTLGTLLLSVVCIVGYGGILRGVLPASAGISWESHAAGLVAGVVLAWLGSNEAKKRRGIGAPVS
jgi:membrane associated rhomboid family serine protease